MVNISFAPQSLVEVALVATLVKATLVAQHRAQGVAEQAQPRTLVANQDSRSWLGGLEAPATGTLSRVLKMALQARDLQVLRPLPTWAQPSPSPARGEYAPGFGSMAQGPRTFAYSKAPGLGNGQAWPQTREQALALASRTKAVQVLPGFEARSPKVSAAPALLAPPTLRATLAWLGIDIPNSASQGWVEENLAKVEGILASWGPSLAPSVKGQVRTLAGPSRKEVGAVRRYLRHLLKVCARKARQQARSTRSQARLRDSQHWHNLAEVWQSGTAVSAQTPSEAWAQTLEATLARKEGAMSPAERKALSRARAKAREAQILRGDRERIGNTGPSRAWMEK